MLLGSQQIHKFSARARLQRLGGPAPTGVQTAGNRDEALLLRPRVVGVTVPGAGPLGVLHREAFALGTFAGKPAREVLDPPLRAELLNYRLAGGRDRWGVLRGDILPPPGWGYLGTL